MAEVAFKRVGRVEFRNRFQPTIERSYVDDRSNRTWQSDGYHFDVICKVGEHLDRRTGELVPIYGRPWLTLWIDVRSRKILSFEISPNDQDSGVILRGFYHAALAFGVPENVYIDNGKPYVNRDFYGQTKAERRERKRERHEEAEVPNAGIYHTLGVKTINAIEFNA